MKLNPQTEDENLLRLLYWTGVETFKDKQSWKRLDFSSLLIGPLLIHKVMVELSAIAFRCRRMGKIKFLCNLCYIHPVHLPRASYVFPWQILIILNKMLYAY